LRSEKFLKQGAFMKTVVTISGFVSVMCLMCLSAMAQAQVPGKEPQKPQVMADSAKPIVKKDTLVSDTAQTGFGRLHVISRPDSAQVVVDSAIQGIAPFSLDSIAPGPHTILVKKKGYFGKKINIVVRPQATEEISVFLVKPGSVFVKSDPAGAHCLIDGKEAGNTPCEIAKLKPGDYDLSVRLVNRAAQDRRITVAESKCDTLFFSLSFTQAYLDSVSAYKKAEKEKKERKNRIKNYVVAGVFGAFAVAILIMEALDR
jgi:PEGA domain